MNTKTFTHDNLYLNKPSWVLDLVTNADTEELSNREEEIVGLTTNEEFKVRPIWISADSVQ